MKKTLNLDSDKESLWRKFESFLREKEEIDVQLWKRRRDWEIEMIKEVMGPEINDEDEQSVMERVFGRCYTLSQTNKD